MTSLRVIIVVNRRSSRSSSRRHRSRHKGSRHRSWLNRMHIHHHHQARPSLCVCLPPLRSFSRLLLLFSLSLSLSTGSVSMISHYSQLLRRWTCPATSGSHLVKNKRQTTHTPWQRCRRKQEREKKKERTEKKTNAERKNDVKLMSIHGCTYICIQTCGG